MDATETGLRAGLKGPKSTDSTLAQRAGCGAWGAWGSRCTFYSPFGQSWESQAVTWLEVLAELPCWDMSSYS